MIRRLVLLLLVALAAVLWRRRRIPTAADLMALDDPAFVAHLRRTGMAQQVESALGRLRDESDDASWDDDGLWSRVAGSVPL